ncbi:MAG TPA: sugar ABC transporter permease [Bacilli bacterium]|nr:sugar ABC transporter permease [Bacilli bacterium]
MNKNKYFREDADKPADLKSGGGDNVVQLSGENAVRPMKIKQGRTLPLWAKVVISLLPAMIFLTFFTFYPMINTTIIAFIEDFSWQQGAGSFSFSNFFRQMYLSGFTSAAPPPGFDGGIFIAPEIPRFSFQNFGLVLNDLVFRRALMNTAILTVISVPLTIIISLLLSVAINSIKAFKGFFQTVFFLPYVTNAIAVGMVFNVLFSPEPSGIMNQIIQIFGGTPTAWVELGAPQGVEPMTKFSMGVVLIAQSVWSGMAFKILVFMSGLATIDKQYYDAAKIDGTRRIRIFSKITVPLLSPQIFYITITSFIGAFKMYSSIISVVGKGPTDFGGVDGTLWITVVGYIYRFRSDDLPRAAAGALVLLVLVLLITMVQTQISKKRVHY